MAWWTWGTWTDVLIDSGRELYFPWQITEGRHLYRDLASFNGPLSAYLNALWFELFGVGLRTLVWANLLWLGVLTLLLFVVLSRIGNRLAATISGVVFLLLFAFGEYDDVANFNYVTPYSHELVHGVLLSFGALTALGRFIRTRTTFALFGTGVIIGLVSLTKPEVFVAAAITIGGGALLTIVRAFPAPSARAWRVGVVAAGIAAPVAIAVIALSRVGSWTIALGGVSGPYRHLVDPEVSGLVFYQRLTGMASPGRSLLVMATASLTYAVLFGAIAWAARTRDAKGRRTEAVFAGAVICLVGVLVWPTAIAERVAVPFPAILMATVAIMAWRLRVTWHDERRALATIEALATVSFAALLLIKVVLNAKLYRYGFALTMPAAMVVVVALVAWIPAAIDRRGGDGVLFRNVSLIAVAAVAMIFMRVHSDRLARVSFAVGAGVDAMRGDSRALPVNAALDAIRRNVGPGNRLVVLPEGILLNYLARRQSSVPFPNFLPPEFVMFGGERLLHSLKQSPPEFVALVDRPLAEYGSAGFGIDFGQDMIGWVNANYGEVASIAGAPIAGRSFGVRLLARTAGDR